MQMQELNTSDTVITWASHCQELVACSHKWQDLAPWYVNMWCFVGILAGVVGAVVGVAWCIVTISEHYQKVNELHAAMLKKGKK